MLVATVPNGPVLRPRSWGRWPMSAAGRPPGSMSDMRDSRQRDRDALKHSATSIKYEGEPVWVSHGARWTEDHRWTLQSSRSSPGSVLFSELPDRQREDLAGRLRRRRYARGEAVFIKGDEGNSLYIIESGRVHIKLTAEDGREVVLNSLGPGEISGDLSLFDGEPRSADAVAVEGSHLVLLERRDFLRFLSDYPSAAVTLLAVFSRRLRHGTRTSRSAYSG